MAQRELTIGLIAFQGRRTCRIQRKLKLCLFCLSYLLFHKVPVTRFCFTSVVDTRVIRQIVLATVVYLLIAYYSVC
jgi:hypothetical protein